MDDAVETAKQKEQAAEGFYTGGGLKAEAIKTAATTLKGSGGKFKKRAAAVVIMLVLVGALVYVVLSPMIKIATIGYNLKKALGFDSTSAILEEQASYITGEMLAKGRVPEAYAEDLAAAGIEVGQVTLAGEFVRTNSYIAGLDEAREVAADGEYYANETGELAVRFGDKIVSAADFVAAIEASPEMYAAYSEAANIKARYYYSKDVTDVYNSMGISRGMFNGWESTGDHESDAQSFKEMLEKGLNVDASALLSVAGEEEYDCSYTQTDESGNAVTGEDGNPVTVEATCTRQIEGQENASSNAQAAAIISGVKSKTKDTTTDSATEKASQLLNVAVSSVEPYEAANAFMAIEEAIEMAQVGDNGPVNEAMNMLTESTEVTYTDVNTGTTATKDVSILETENFVAAVAEEPYSVAEANNFSRDRVLNVTSAANNAVIEDTTMALEEKKKKSMAVLWVSGSTEADNNVLARAEDSLTKALTEKNSDLFASVVGGNRAVEGGSFISNSLNARTLGAMPSDAATIAAYHQEVDKVLARQAEADRATHSPLDISSPNTFLGALVRQAAMAGLASSAKSKGTVVSAVSATVGLAGDSLAGLVSGGALAEGADDTDFETLMGNCDTVKVAASVEGDLYCNSHNTISTGYMQRTKEDWQRELAGDLDASGEIDKGSDLAEFVTLGMDREVTVGVKSAAVCEAWKKGNQSVWGKLVDKIKGVFALYEECKTTADQQAELDRVATGAKYTLSSRNANVGSVKEYSGYVLYDTVSSLLEEGQSSVARFREEYYKENPVDNSAAGRLARISGLTRGEVEVALGYANYLDTIARYNAAERYAFGAPVVERPLLTVGEKLAVAARVRDSIYVMWSGRVELADVRNRTATV